MRKSQGWLHKILGAGNSAQEFHWVAGDPGRWIRSVVVEVVPADGG
jgi:hypothetical protein